MSKEDPEVISALREAVEAAAQLARELFESRSFDIELKRDGTPVTSADVEVERCMLEVLRRRLPELPIVGEEEASTDQSRPGTYAVVDPIDGTSNFLRGVPFFGITAAVIRDGVIQLGVVADPMHARTFHAERGRGAYVNDERMEQRRNETPLAKATIAMSAELLPSDLRSAFLPALLERIDRHQAIRSVALEVTGIASGWSEAAVFPSAAAWDFAAAALVLEEVGGVWSDFQGKQTDFEDPRARHEVVAAASGELHQAILELLRAGSRNT